MLYDERSARDNVRNREGKRVFYLGQGDQLTSGARDYLNRERITILPASQAKKEQHRLLNGGWVEEKPEHMTHLNGDVLVDKTHPRIAFRGAVDALEAELLLCAVKVPEMEKELQEILTAARQLIRCDVMEEPVKERKLCGLTQEELRRRSHMPQEYYGQPHFMPEAADGEKLLWLNRCRCLARQAELAAVRAFRDENGNPKRVDILREMNRMSSMLYILMIRLKAGK